MIRKSPWVSLVNCSGCITGDTEAILGNGEILSAENLIEDKLNGNIFDDVNGNHVLGCSVKGSILSFENNSPKISNVVSAYKVKAPERIFEVKTGNSHIKLTPNHKVLVDDFPDRKWKKVDELKIGDYVYSPKKISIDSSIPNILGTLSDNWVVNLNEEKRQELMIELKEKFGTLVNASKELKIQKERLYGLSNLRMNELKRILEKLDKKIDDFSDNILKLSKKGYFHNVPNKYPDAKLLYVLGLIESDGYITSRKNLIHKVCFDNNEKALIDVFMKYSKSWVGNSKISYYNSKKQPNLYRAYTYSRLFTDICSFFGIRLSKKEHSNFKEIFKLPENLIASFIGGYFDGDGSAVIMKPNPRGKKPRITLEFSIKDQKIATQLQLLLKRLGIISMLSSSRNKSSFGTKIMHKVSISFEDDILNFIKLIPIRHPKKIKKFSEIESVLMKRRGKFSKLNQAPLRCNFLIKKIRKKYDLKTKDITELTFLSMIENKKRVQKHTVKRVIKSFYKLGVNNEDLKELHSLISDNFYLDPIKEISEIEFRDKFVYDFTVEGTHCYIPSGGFLISNCNGCAISCLPLITPKYDVERFGVVLRPSVRHADVLLVTGPTNEKTKHILKRIYDQVPKDKKVIAIGNCAISGCIFKKSYNVKQRVDEVVPVDIYIPGCPPTTEAIIYGITKLLGDLNKNKRAKNREI